MTPAAMMIVDRSVTINHQMGESFSGGGGGDGRIDARAPSTDDSE
jgi:hypothetical protein